MFTKFARRLTGWYVAAAVTLVVLVIGAFAVVGLDVYIHVIQDGVDADAREVQAFAVRAATRHEGFIPAAIEVEGRLSRPGCASSPSVSHRTIRPTCPVTAARACRSWSGRGRRAVRTSRRPATLPEQVRPACRWWWMAG